MDMFKCHLKGLRDVGALTYLRRFKAARYLGELFTLTQYSSPNTDSTPHFSARAIMEDFGKGAEDPFVRDFKDFVEKESAEGEWRAYSTADGRTAAADVFIKNDGTIVVTSRVGNASVQVNPDGTVNLNGTAYEGLVKIIELTASLNTRIAQLQAHTHSAGAPPDQTFTPFAQTEYENLTVTHGAGI